jgi:hypothetical protein
MKDVRFTKLLESGREALFELDLAGDEIRSQVLPD